MKKIFKMFTTIIFVWFLFSTINYIWPANGIYSAWNIYRVSPDVVSKIFMCMSLAFISACYGYSVGKDETPARKPAISQETIEEYKELLSQTNDILSKIDDLDNKDS